MADSAELRRQLVSLGLLEEDVVLVHTAFSKLRPWVATPSDWISLVLGACDTALFPAHTGTADHRPANVPTFDPARSPALGIGIVPEVARTWPGAVRSLQPTHSVTAIGPRANEQIATHHRSKTPCDSASPYQKLWEIGGKILLAGCDQESNTSLHAVEEVVGVAYHLQESAAEIPIVGHAPWIGRLHDWGTARRFMAIDDDLTQLGIQRVGPLGSGQARLIDAARMAEFAVEWLKQDPELFVAKS